jgi:hypothetical protein
LASDGEAVIIAPYRAEEAPALDEHTWLSCHEPQKMLLFLQNSASPSERKLRLWGCACVRRVWHLLTGPECQGGVAVAERFADGEATADELAAANALLWAAVNSERDTQRRSAAGAVGGTTTPPGSLRADIAATAPAHLVYRELVGDDNYGSVWANVRHKQGREAAGLLRDIFGPRPFRLVCFDPAWGTPAVIRLAQRVYEDRQLPCGTLDATLLRVLADALEDAGASTELWGHLRQEGAVHVRGCWVVDLLLEKEGCAP